MQLQTENYNYLFQIVFFYFLFMFLKKTYLDFKIQKENLKLIEYRTQIIIHEMKRKEELKNTRVEREQKREREREEREQKRNERVQNRKKNIFEFNQPETIPDD